jgi:hypothetical protein
MGGSAGSSIGGALVVGAAVVGAAVVGAVRGGAAVGLQSTRPVARNSRAKPQPSGEPASE